MLQKWKQRYIGDKTFYRMVLTIALPLVIQQGITSFVSLIDNLMVGALGEEPISSVSIINQLLNIYNLALFGGLSGASIFGAQFFGRGDWNGMRDTFRFRLVFGVGISAVAIGVFWFFGDTLTLLFLENENNTAQQIANTLQYAMEYLHIAIFGLLPFMVSQVYTNMLRETGETLHPMIASVIAIITNLFLNYCLIFGHFGLPKMGVAGAALATVIARVLEMLYIVVYSHMHAVKYPYIQGVYRSLRMPADLCRRIARMGAPLMVNEIGWSLGMTVINGNYASRGLDVVAATNIAATAWNLFGVVMITMGSVVAIMVGQQLGSGNIEGAKDVDRKLIFVTEVFHIFIGAVLLIAAHWIPMLYEVDAHTRELSTSMLRIQGLILPMQAYAHVAYFTIRSGGKTLVTFLFDSLYTWCIPVVLSFVLCRYTVLPILVCYAAVQVTDVLKMLIAIPLLKSGFWAKKIIN